MSDQGSSSSGERKPAAEAPRRPLATILYDALGLLADGVQLHHGAEDRVRRELYLLRNECWRPPPGETK